jgi:hypothetical protein
MPRPRAHIELPVRSHLLGNPILRRQGFQSFASIPKPVCGCGCSKGTSPSRKAFA